MHFSAVWTQWWSVTWPIEIFVLFYERSDSRRALKPKESPTVMQPNSNERDAHSGNGTSLTLQPELTTRTPVPGAAAANPNASEVRVPLPGGLGEAGGGPTSRRCRVNSHTHSHSPDSDLDSGEPSTSVSELRCVLRWLQKSLPFLVILCAKLVIQHALGEYK